MTAHTGCESLGKGKPPAIRRHQLGLVAVHLPHYARHRIARRLVCLLALSCSLSSLAAYAAVPSVPTLTITSNLCFGSNDARWTASSGATSYELWGSAFQNFTPQSLWYSGSATNSPATVSGTTFFHVRACNASGCSAFSNTAVGHYFRGCS